MNFVDLHTHSVFSDGTFTPEKLVSLAVEKKLCAIALTDHDTVAGVSRCMEAGKKYGLEVIPGIEFSTEYKGKDIHIVGLDIDLSDPVFLNHLTTFQKERDRRNAIMIEKMAADHIPISIEKMQEAFGCNVWTRANFGRYLIDCGIVSTMEEAFRLYIGDDCPYYEPKVKIPSEKAVQIIRENGGIPILAHPFSYHMEKQEIRSLIRLLKPHGLIGMEAFYSTHSTANTDTALQMIREFGLAPSGGSDFHGSNKPHIDLGSGIGNLKISKDVLDRLRNKAKIERTKHGA